MKKIFSAILVSILCVLFFAYTFNEEVPEITNSNTTQHSEESEKTSDPKGEVIKNNDISILTTIEKESTAKIPFEEDWCVAEQDLSQEDLAFSRAQAKEWSISKKDAVFNNGLRDFDSSNSELIEPYKDTPVDELVRLGNDNYQLALVALLQRSDVSIKQKAAASERLVLLGDAGLGISHLVGNELTLADNRYRTTKEVDNIVKKHLIEAFALVEYAMSRQETSSLRFLLKYAFAYPRGDDQLEIVNALSTSDLVKVESRTKGFIEDFNEARIYENLPRIQDIDTPKIAHHVFKRKVALYFRQHEADIMGSQLYALWGDNYLEKDLCLRRLIASRPQ